MSPFDSIGQLRMALNDLKPHELKAAIRRYERGGLPSSSIPERITGGGGERWPIDDEGNATDATDRRHKTVWKDYCRDLAKAVELIEGCIRDQNSVLLDAPMLVDEPEIPCDNLACTLLLEPGRKTGSCPRCRQWHHRHGVEYPQKREQEAS